MWNVFLCNYSEVLAEAVYIGVDPFMRGFTISSPTGVVIIGSQIARYKYVQFTLIQDY